jgi:hypothetical protein
MAENLENVSHKKQRERERECVLNEKKVGRFSLSQQFAFQKFSFFFLPPYTHYILFVGATGWMRRWWQSDESFQLITKLSTKQ